MAQYNTLNVKLANSQFNKLKSAIRNGTEVTLNISSNLIGNSNDETNFAHKLLLTDTQVSTIRKTFANVALANIKFSKTQLSKMKQSGGILGDLVAVLLAGKEALKRNISVAPKLVIKLAEKATEYYIRK